LLTAVERRRLHSFVRWELRQLGISPTADLVRKLVQWRFLMESPYWHVLKQKHPDWFAPFLKPWTNVPSSQWDIFQDVPRTALGTIRVPGVRR
jgi:hypothetical protein